jgi:3-deoxy-D-arabino-heptulosonate 7-phosphate (DAHP) synthase
MVEVHPCPAVALSDSGQQLTLESFRAMLENLREGGLLRSAEELPAGKAADAARAVM